MNEKQFVELIKNNPHQYVHKLDKALNQNYIVQLSRPMLLELAGIYQLVNPKYDVRMLNLSCASCVLTFLKDVAKIYFKLLYEYETIEEKIVLNEVTTDIIESDLDKISNEEIIVTDEVTPTIKKRGRPFKTQQ